MLFWRHANGRLARMQSAAESESWLPVRIDVRLGTRHVAEPQSSQAIQVLRITVSLHLGVKLRIEKKGNEPARKQHLLSTLRSSIVRQANSNTTGLRGSQKCSLLSVGQRLKAPLTRCMCNHELNLGRSLRNSPNQAQGPPAVRESAQRGAGMSAGWRASVGGCSNTALHESRPRMRNRPGLSTRPAIRPINSRRRSNESIGRKPARSSR